MGPSTAERAASASAVFAFVVDRRMWRHAAVAIQQLNSRRTALPIVVFNHTSLPAKARQAFTSLGALLLSLEPPMPIPAAFVQHFETRRNLNGAWPKLGVWCCTQSNPFCFPALSQTCAHVLACSPEGEHTHAALHPSTSLLHASMRCL